MPDLTANVEELYIVIGELEFLRRKQSAKLQELFVQADEMSKEITRLKEENGGLVKTDNNE
jgi:hypothetical protein